MLAKQASNVSFALAHTAARHSAGIVVRSTTMEATAGVPQPLVLLIHGAWHGAWCWAALQAALDHLGVASYAVDLPGHGASSAPTTDLRGDATFVAELLRHSLAAAGRIVLVGHSYGGMVISEVASIVPDRIAHLVYVAAFCPLANESLMGMLGTFPPVDIPMRKAIVPSPTLEGFVVIDPALARTVFYADCSDAQAAAAARRLGAQFSPTFVQPVTANPRERILSTYVICSSDQAVHVIHQELMASRCTHQHTLVSSHSPFLSKPRELALVIAGVLAK